MASTICGIYGTPPRDLASAPDSAIQFSPLLPGSATLEDCSPASLSSMTMLAPPGTLERRYALALALRSLQSGAALTVLAPKDKGGARIEKELADFGCAVETTGKRHYRICTTKRPMAPVGLDSAITAGGPQRVEAIGLWSQPGAFSWNRVDPGSALLIANLPALAGNGADLGSGIGVLGRAILASPAVTQLTLVDLDRRALAAARRNIDDPRAAFLWCDIAGSGALPDNLDFVVMNPPFHDGGADDQALGQAFIRRAAAMLRRGGRCWLVANRHLPYEAGMKNLFTRVTLKIETDRYKIYDAQK
jgi:16S rRNA (guanine1207-N2)-methyltransferase